jgi:hypothetical protein
LRTITEYNGTLTWPQEAFGKGKTLGIQAITESGLRQFRAQQHTRTEQEKHDNYRRKYLSQRGLPVSTGKYDILPYQNAKLHKPLAQRRAAARL